MKRFLAICLTLAMLLGIFCMTAAAYTVQSLNTADALYHLGLFFGTGKSYELDNSLTRNQGMALLIRMLGKEEESKQYAQKHPFTDVAEWAAGYVGYAYENGLTKGISATKFGGDMTMTQQMFLTMTLRALGYSDSEGGDFTYDEAVLFAYGKKLVDDDTAKSTLLRSSVVEIFWRALNTACKDGKLLSDRLISQKVFTKTQFVRAAAIRTSGRSKTEGTGEKQGSLEPEDPNAPSDPTNPTNPTQPEQPADPSQDMTWSAYCALSATEQKAFRDSIGLEAFKKWRTKAQQAEYVTPTEITAGTEIIIG